MSLVARHALLYTLSNFAVAGVSLLLMPVLTRLLGPGEYGMLAVFASVHAALGAVVGLSAHGAVNRRWVDGDHAAMPAYLGAAMAVVVASALVLLLPVLLAPPALVAWLGVPRAWLFAAWLAVSASALLALRMSLWQIRGQALPYAALQFGLAVGNAGLTLLLVAGGAGADGRVLAVVAAALVAAVVALVSLQRDGLLAWQVRRADLRDLLQFGVPLLPHLVGLYLLANTDRMIVAGLAGVEAAGFYLVAAQIASVIGLAGDAVNRAVTPWLFARLAQDDAAVRRRIVQLTWLAYGAVLLLALLLAGGGGWLVAVLAGPDWAAAGGVVGLLALQQALTCLYLGVTNYVFWARRTGLLSVVTLVSGTAGVLLMVWWVPAHGITGAALAAVVSSSLRFVLTFVLAARLVPMPWFSAFARAPAATGRSA